VEGRTDFGTLQKRCRHRLDVVWDRKHGCSESLKRQSGNGCSGQGDAVLRRSGYRQGSSTVLAQITAEVLGIEPSEISLVIADTGAQRTQELHQRAGRLTSRGTRSRKPPANSPTFCSPRRWMFSRLQNLSSSLKTVLQWTPGTPTGGSPCPSSPREPMPRAGL